MQFYYPIGQRSFLVDTRAPRTQARVLNAFPLYAESKSNQASYVIGTKGRRQNPPTETPTVPLTHPAVSQL